MHTLPQADRRNAAINKIKNTFLKAWELKKEIDKELFLAEIMNSFSISKRTAVEYLDEGFSRAEYDLKKKEKYIEDSIS